MRHWVGILSRRPLVIAWTSSLLLHGLLVGSLVLAGVWAQRVAVRFGGERQVQTIQLISLPTPSSPPHVRIELPDPASAPPPPERRLELARQADEPYPFERPLDPEVPPQPLERSQPIARHEEVLPELEPPSRNPPRPTRAPTASVRVEIPQWAGTDAKIPPDLSSNPPPRYPALAAERGWQGEVLVRLDIDASGRVTAAHLERSSGYAVLDQAALDTLRRWRGRPAEQNGQPVSTTEYLPIRFRLPWK